MTRCFNNESLYHSCLKRPAGGCVWLGSHNLQEGPLATAHWGTMGSLQPTVGIRNYPRLDPGPRQPLHYQHFCSNHFFVMCI